VEGDGDVPECFKLGSLEGPGDPPYVRVAPFKLHTFEFDGAGEVKRSR
jgi:hypothetical protein